MPRKRFSEIASSKMSSESLARAHARTRQMLAEMPLQELRRARTLSQATLAEVLGANQPQVSKIESSTDMYVSTLRRYIEAMGGELDIIARFPEGSIRITQFASIEIDGPASAAAAQLRPLHWEEAYTASFPEVLGRDIVRLHGDINARKYVWSSKAFHFSGGPRVKTIERKPEAGMEFDNEIEELEPV